LVYKSRSWIDDRGLKLLSRIEAAEREREERVCAIASRTKNDEVTAKSRRSRLEQERTGIRLLDCVDQPRVRIELVEKRAKSLYREGTVYG
jgi:hypothetical protein